MSTGAATTLSAAINDWLKAEDALDAFDVGLVDEGTEDAYRALHASAKHFDLVSTALDGLRAQLLGFAASEGLRRPSDSAGGTLNPAPAAAPRSLVAGAMSLLRARLVDAFGRVLELPETALKDPCTPSRRCSTSGRSRWDMRRACCGRRVGCCDGWKQVRHWGGTGPPGGVTSDDQPRVWFPAARSPQ